MTVKELIEQLKGVDPERIVVLSKDEEGNNFSPLAELDDEMVYVPYSTWSGETHIEKLTPDLEKAGFSEDDLYHGDNPPAQPALVLWPVN